MAELEFNSLRQSQSRIAENVEGLKSLWIQGTMSGPLSGNQSQNQLSKSRRWPITTSVSRYLAPVVETSHSILNGIKSSTSPFLPTFKYGYRPLKSREKEIRLLEVHPGKGAEPLCCTVHHTYILAEDMIPYETVSYCWGRKPGETVIEIDQIPVRVTLSAARALHRMRSPVRSRILWIDAICIDQGSDKERSEQVAIMADIYRNTSRNLVWLGDDGGSSKAAVSTLERVLQSIRDETRDYGDLWLPVHTPEGRLKFDGSALDPRIDLTHLRPLFLSPWFTRLWVAQEVALSRINLCYFGPVTIDLVDVLRAAIWLTYNQNCFPAQSVFSPNLNAACSLWYLVDYQFAVGKFHRGFYPVFDRLRYFMATVPVDNVYALLGILNTRSAGVQQNLAQIVPDYTRPLMEVFRDFTRAMIEDSKRLWILQEANARDHTRSGPSWAHHFDFKGIEYDTYGPGKLDDRFRSDNDIGLPESTISHTKDPNILTLFGFVADEIQCLAARMNTQDLWYRSGMIPTLNEIKALADKMSVLWPQRNIEREIADTLVAGRNAENEQFEEGDMKYYEAFLGYLEEYHEFPPAPEYTHTTSLDGNAQRAVWYGHRMQRACFRRRFSVTRSGFVGLCPEISQHGDFVVILYGSAVPFVIRPVGSGQYRLVGECYIHGIMNGEAVKKHKELGKDDVRFEII